MKTRISRSLSEDSIVGKATIGASVHQGVSSRAVRGAIIAASSMVFRAPAPILPWHHDLIRPACNVKCPDNGSDPLSVMVTSANRAAVIISQWVGG
jgi:hypothetical protein